MLFSKRIKPVQRFGDFTAGKSGLEKIGSDLINIRLAVGIPFHKTFEEVDQNIKHVFFHSSPVM